MKRVSSRGCGRLRRAGVGASAPGCASPVGRSFRRPAAPEAMQVRRGSPRGAPRAHVGLREVPVQRRRVELRERVDLGDVAVDTVADGDVDQAVVGAQRHGGLGAVLGQRVQPRARAAAEDDAQNGLRRHATRARRAASASAWASAACTAPMRLAHGPLFRRGRRPCAPAPGRAPNRGAHQATSQRLGWHQRSALAHAPRQPSASLPSADRLVICS